MIDVKLHKTVDLQLKCTCSIVHIRDKKLNVFLFYLFNSETKTFRS